MNGLFTPDVIIAILGVFGGSASAYAAIKSDLTKALVQAQANKEALEQHLSDHSHKWERRRTPRAEV